MGHYNSEINPYAGMSQKEEASARAALRSAAKERELAGIAAAKTHAPAALRALTQEWGQDEGMIASDIAGWLRKNGINYDYQTINVWAALQELQREGVVMRGTVGQGSHGYHLVRS